MTRILIADDHAVVRRGVKEILSREFPRASFGEAERAQEILDRVRASKWDLVILDINIPGRGGIEVLHEIKAIRAKLPVLMFSVHAEEQFALRCLKSGATGYLTKDSVPEELTKAVRKILAGGRYVSQELAERLALELASGSERPPHEALSNREHQILLLIAGGKSVADIAAELSLSAKTVSTYRARILEKMGMKTNADLIRYALQHGLVE